jgi:hypothetical protein
MYILFYQPGTGIVHRNSNKKGIKYRQRICHALKFHESVHL